MSSAFQGGPQGNQKKKKNQDCRIEKVELELHDDDYLFEAGFFFLPFLEETPACFLPTYLSFYLNYKPPICITNGHCMVYKRISITHPQFISFLKNSSTSPKL
uniref:Uncharacterized protein n=1 Tax=Micrurus spixii TaxID=129469 RepID=A0A2D4MW01_9SAUR